MYYIGCGHDISRKSSKDGRNIIGSGSISNPEPRKLVMSTWTSLLNKQLNLQGISIDHTTIDLDNPGRMCKTCFTQFGTYQKLITQLEGKLSVALQKLERRELLRVLVLLRLPVAAVMLLLQQVKEDGLALFH